MIAGDGIVQQSEINSGQPIAIAGSVGGDVKDGDSVILFVNQQRYTAAVSNAAFAFSVNVADLSADSDSKLDFSVTTTTGDTRGEATAMASATYTVEPVISAFIMLDANITADDEISHQFRSAMAITGQIPGQMMIACTRFSRTEKALVLLQSMSVLRR